ncbi:flagellar brake protein [Azohydromonas aeria]|uniref:flagellar brake protein n=1 Tax=Azohydromonas aeria TaxID=2590212 RepID=UPI0012F74FFD|nr:flagellar brake protein [Azohydromonas aeria]
MPTGADALADEARRPACTALPPPEDAEVRQLRTPLDIASLLRRLIAEGTPLHLSTPEGALLGTRLLAHDGVRRRIGFEVADAAAPQLQALLAGAEALATAYLDGVQLQFELHDLLLAHGAAGSSLQAALPACVLRISRRRSRRVRPAGAPTAHLRCPDDPGTALSLQVLDVSLGGCALLLPHGQPPLLHPGQTVPHAWLELDIDTRLQFTLELLHVTFMSTDAAGLRLGCRFADAQPQALQRLEKYLWRAQGKRSG